MIVAGLTPRLSCHGIMAGLNVTEVCGGGCSDHGAQADCPHREVCGGQVLFEEFRHLM